jgi:hypothetical protein
MPAKTSITLDPDLRKPLREPRSTWQAEDDRMFDHLLRLKIANDCEAVHTCRAKSPTCRISARPRRRCSKVRVGKPRKFSGSKCLPRYPWKRTLLNAVGTSQTCKKATSVRPPAQGLKSCIRCGHLLNERLKSNDDFGCSLTVASDKIEHLLDFFQIWRFSAQPV